MARGGRGPPGHGILRAHRTLPPPRGPCPGSRRPHRRSGDRRRRTARGHPRPRLGRAHLPGLGAGAPRDPRGHRADQHGGAPRQRRAHPLGTASRPEQGRARAADLREHRVPGHHARAVRSGGVQGRQARLQGSLHQSRAPRGHRPLRGGHPRRRGPPVPRRLRADRGADERARGPHAAAVGHRGPGVPAALPGRPHAPRPARGRAPLRGRQAPAARGPGHRHPAVHVARGALRGRRARRRDPPRAAGPRPRRVRAVLRGAGRAAS